MDPHASLGPIPVFVGLCCFDIQASQYRREQLGDCLDTATLRPPVENFRDDFRFAASRIVR